MNLVDGDGLLEPVGFCTLGNPGGVGPLVHIEIRDDGAGGRADLGAKGVRVGFKRDHVSIGADDLVFVDGTLVELGDEEFPDAGGAASAHGVGATVPLIEIADYADAASAGRPHG